MWEFLGELFKSIFPCSAAAESSRNWNLLGWIAMCFYKLSTCWNWTSSKANLLLCLESNPRHTVEDEHDSSPASRAVCRAWWHIEAMEKRTVYARSSFITNVIIVQGWFSCFRCCLQGVIGEQQLTRAGTSSSWLVILRWAASSQFWFSAGQWTVCHCAMRFCFHGSRSSNKSSFDTSQEC